MAITKSGLYGLTLEKMFIDTAAESLEAEDNKELMVTDTEAPNFTTHNSRRGREGADFRVSHLAPPQFVQQSDNRADSSITVVTMGQNLERKFLWHDAGL